MRVQHEDQAFSSNFVNVLGFVPIVLEGRAQQWEHLKQMMQINKNVVTSITFPNCDTVTHHQRPFPKAGHSDNARVKTRTRRKSQVGHVRR
jgi:hypothetical protein